MNRSLIQLFFLTIFLFLSFHLIAEEIELKISYLGISAVNVYTQYDYNSTENTHTIEINAKSTRIGNLFNRLDNTYKVKTDKDFLPIVYNKEIIQKNMNDSIKTVFFHNKNSAKKKYKNNTKPATEYSIHNNTRDFFSALYFIRNNLENIEEHDIYVDAKNNIWQVLIEITGNEEISSNLGTIKTIKTKINFKKITDREPISSDILTNNLVDPDNDLYFWFTNDEKKIPVKAEYDRNPFSVFWEIVNYDN